ncbi:UDP-glucose 4-epimerase GalE [Patescibacteria group bacterium]|nr:UDP-glucose 4-epimerase GalE [Patescibacteria group bacterium]MBU0776902.1 UDP-glucose 4-epimerase GalE [Patescibacteria group bacterium]MBU0846303.1 UDP-glucose 4-epimerase GalE [Patescibacteria group bacterium]MBU0922567.1 UDP-glucose 4-epimerase GalE [Patescibacteria group bacterium]MBU1845121.1 UDP-glucose 4-epimerase GalE [Patescibacteria group bacterium]
MKKKILVTGGAGYIGSFIVRELKNEGYGVVIVDNLSQGHKEAVPGFEFHKIDLVREKIKLETLFKKNKFVGVIHMASFIQMGESFKNPNKYFQNNLIGVMNLLDVMLENNVNKIVFSSSAGVYGSPKKLPIKEDDPKNPENPYGETKLMIEDILRWFDKAYDFKSVSIRYFNAAGAALDGSIGEAHPNESHIIPLILKAVLAGREFTLFGDDYDTPDGTCVRDYVHVLDLAKAHTAAIQYLINGGKTNQYNAGTGGGYSNKEIVEEVKKVAGDFKVKMGPRRPGDADTLYASIDKIKKDLGWEPKYKLKDIIKTAYKWHKSHPDGYKGKK